MAAEVADEVAAEMGAEGDWRGLELCRSAHFGLNLASSLLPPLSQRKLGRERKDGAGPAGFGD